MRLYYKYKDWDWSDVIGSVEITDEEGVEISELTPQKLYNFIKQESIGKMTPLGRTRFLPCYQIGRIKISMQISYYLWSKRDD